jgi:N-methylhydantoinase A
MLLMTSGGGLTTLDAAREFPIRLVESGPAGGAMLAAHIGQNLGLAQVLSFDMGGTTAKICLIDDGAPLYSRAFEVDRSYRFKRGSGLPVRIPVIEMVEIGAGGGSIAGVDTLSRVRVGPASAGSEPGPACYGRGGDAPTVTDADTVLGKLSGAWFADGKLAFDAAAAAAAVIEGVATPLNLDVTEAAHAIAEVVEENMASASRAHAAEWGRSLEGRTLIAFGGAAPLHAAALARKLKISDVLVPAGAGVGSALGFLLAPVRFDVVRSHYARLGSLDIPRVEGLLLDMRIEAQAVVVGAAPNAEYLEHRQAFMRYVGQGYEVAVELKSGPIDTSALRVGFDEAYRTLYGRTIPGMEIEILSWTLAVTAATELTSVNMIQAQPLSQPLPASGNLWNDRAMTEAAIVPRAALETHKVYSGPMLIVEPQTTTVVPESFDAVVLDDGTLRLAHRSEETTSDA